MKGNLLRKIEALGQQAARIQQAVQKAPAKVEQLAQAVTLTGNQLLDLKAGLRSTFDQLRADGEEQLLRVVKEVHESADALREAGFELTGVDLELTPAPRAILRLVPLREIQSDVVQQLAELHPDHRYLNGIMAALVRCTEVTQRLDLGALDRQEICVGIGAIPSLRVNWRVSPGIDAATTPPPILEPGSAPVPPAPPQPARPTTPSPSPSWTGETPTGGFFESRPAYASRSTAPVPARSDAATAPASIPPPSTTTEPPVQTDSSWGAGALDRFKKMPRLGRRE